MVNLNIEHPPVNPLLEKWKKEYPPTPRPEYSQVCDGYSCIWCGRCPSGEFWKCPEEDLEVYEAWCKEYSMWLDAHPDYLNRIFVEVKEEKNNE